MKNIKLLLNKTSNIIYKILRKIANIIDNDNNSALLKSILKIILLIVFYIIIGFIAEGLILFGTNIIYNIGTTARGLLSFIWKIIVNFMYFLFIVVTLYQLLYIAKKDQKFLTLSTDKMKNKEQKKKLFMTTHNIVEILKVIIIVPLLIIEIFLLFILGLMVGYLKEKIYLWGLFIGLLGLIIFFVAAILTVRNLLSERLAPSKTNLYIMILSSFLVVSGSILCLFETLSYKNVDSLTSDFPMFVTRHEYKLDDDSEYILLHNDSDHYLDFVVDDDLGSYLEIKIEHTNTNKVNSSIYEEKDNVKISYDEELDLELADMEKLFNLGISCIKDKTSYNYTLLKYAKIEVRVSSKYANKIKFVDKRGRLYSPYERNIG